MNDMNLFSLFLRVVTVGKKQTSFLKERIPFGPLLQKEIRAQFKNFRNSKGREKKLIYAPLFGCTHKLYIFGKTNFV